MTDTINPFDRGEVLGHRPPMPRSLVPVLFDSLGDIQNSKPEDQQTFTVVRFLEHGDLPGIVARWLQYRSFTDNRVMTHTADDRYRFGNTTATTKRFLRDQHGRRLYCAINKDPVRVGPNGTSGRTVRKLAGALWLHPLEGGASGASILRACDAYNKKQQSEAGTEDILDPSRLATLASRIYSENRGQRLHTPFLLKALEDYYGAWEDSCDGVVVRMSKSDVNAMYAFQHGETVKHEAPFEPIHSEDGVVFLLHRRSQPQTADAAV